MPSLRPTARAARFCPAAYITTDSARCCCDAFVTLPSWKPAERIFCPVVAASPDTLVPFSTATVTLEGSTPSAGDFFLWCLAGLDACAVGGGLVPALDPLFVLPPVSASTPSVPPVPRA